jgi:hypothetical protein
MFAKPREYILEYDNFNETIKCIVLLLAQDKDHMVLIKAAPVHWSGVKISQNLSWFML